LSTTTRPADAASRDGWVMAGMVIAAASAAVASFTGLRGLALVTGWPARLAWLLPLTLDAYAMTSARVWLASTTRARRARRFARANAVGAIGASIAGNATYHAVTVGLVTVSSPIVVLVGAVPAAVLGLTAHLHALRTLDDQGDEPEDGARDEDEQPPNTEKSRTEDGTEDRPQARTRSGSRRRSKYRTEDELIAAAREADARYRATHNGRPITRDALRVALAIAGPRATELRRQLAAEDEQSAGPLPATDQPPAPDREEALTTE
jgi:Protein of unknown function (DUF2637)